MKYFRPDLFVRSNSRDIDEAMTASDEWESSAKAYRKHLKRISGRLPGKAARFVEEVYLHDAEFLGLDLERPDRCLPIGFPTARVFVRTDEGLVVIAYELAVEPEIQRDLLPPQLAAGDMLWLYDEFDLDSQGNHASHEIFLSSGLSVKLVFEAFDFHKFSFAKLPVPRPVENRISPSIPS